MNILDVNVVVALFRSDDPRHEGITEWFAESRGRGESFTVPDLVWVGFVRVVTNKRIMPVPATFEEAWDFVVALRSQGHYLAFAPHPMTLNEFADLSMNAQASGNLLTDAYIAASAARIGGTVVTFDRDFRKFDGIRVLEPA